MRREITRLSGTGPFAVKADGARPWVRSSYLLGHRVQPLIFGTAREADT